MSRKGFTLIELMVAISIVAILATVGLVMYGQAQKLGRDAKRKQDIRSISIALELYKQTNGSWPSITDAVSADGWVNSTSDSAEWIPGLTSSYISSVPKDPKNSGTYKYSYWRDADAGGYCSDTYLLQAYLENTSDSEAGISYKCNSEHPLGGESGQFLYGPGLIKQ